LIFFFTEKLQVTDFVLPLTYLRKSKQRAQQSKSFNAFLGKYDKTLWICRSLIFSLNISSIYTTVHRSDWILDFYLLHVSCIALQIKYITTKQRFARDHPLLKPLYKRQSNKGYKTKSFSIWTSDYQEIPGIYLFLRIVNIQTPIRITTPASRFLHATFLARYATLLARYASCTLRYASCTLRYASCTLRYAFRPLRYASCTLRYAFYALLTRLHASNTFWSQVEFDWRWLKPERNEELGKEIIMNIYDTE
jgi:hypothetical protein